MTWEDSAVALCQFQCHLLDLNVEKNTLPNVWFGDTVLPWFACCSHSKKTLGSNPRPVGLSLCKLNVLPPTVQRRRMYIRFKNCWIVCNFINSHLDQLQSINQSKIYLYSPGPETYFALKGFTFSTNATSTLKTLEPLDEKPWTGMKNLLQREPQRRDPFLYD